MTFVFFRRVVTRPACRSVCRFAEHVVSPRPAAGLVIWGLVVFGSYRYAERIFLILSLAFLAYPIAAILAKPKLTQVGTNLAWPHFTHSESR